MFCFFLLIPFLVWFPFVADQPCRPCEAHRSLFVWVWSHSPSNCSSQYHSYRGSCSGPVDLQIWHSLVPQRGCWAASPYWQWLVQICIGLRARNQLALYQLGKWTFDICQWHFITRCLGRDVKSQMVYLYKSKGAQWKSTSDWKRCFTVGQKWSPFLKPKLDPFIWAPEAVCQWQMTSSSGKMAQCVPWQPGSRANSWNLSWLSRHCVRHDAKERTLSGQW